MFKKKEKTLSLSNHIMNWWWQAYKPAAA